MSDLPDVNWTPASGVGVGLYLPLPIHTLEELETALEILYSSGWLTGAGRFRIEQPGRTTWHGWGASDFMEAIRRQRARLGKDEGWHSEERADYFDTCPGGWYTLTLRILTGKRRIHGGAHLSAQLAGIPTDMTPTRMLVEAFDLDDAAFFRPLAEDDSVRREQFRRGEVPVDATELLLDADDPNWVRGLVIRNPSLTRPDDKHLRDVLGDDELVICPLASWHVIGDVRRYHLHAIESTYSGEVIVTWAAADWE